jgi:hypothetical protein
MMLTWVEMAGLAAYFMGGVAAAAAAVSDPQAAAEAVAGRIGHSHFFVEITQTHTRPFVFVFTEYTKATCESGTRRMP